MGFFNSLSQDTYDRQYTDRYLFGRIGSYFREERRTLIVIGATLIAFSITGALNPILISSGVEILENKGGIPSLVLLILALLVTLLVDFFFGWYRRRLITRLIAHIISRMRKDSFAAAVNRDLAFYDDNKSGKIVSRITSDTQEFGNTLTIFSDIFTQFVELGILAFVLFTRSAQLMVVLLLWMPIFIAMALFFRSMARKVGRQGARAMATVNDNIQESVSGINVAKNFRREAMIYDEFAEVNRQSYVVNLKRGFVMALIFPALNMLSGFGTGSVVYFGALAVIGGSINLGSWYLFITSVDRFWFPIINLASFWSQLQQGLSAVERIFALIDAENTIKQVDHQPVQAVKGQIEFDDVVFEYKPGVRVLDHFNLSIQPGERDRKSVV